MAEPAAEPVATMATRPVCPLPPARCTLLRGVMLPVSGADGDGGGYVRRDVLLDGGVIAKIEPAGSLPAAPGAELLDCAERLLLPGFVNGHTHSVEHWARGLIKPLPLELWVQQLMRHEPRGEAGWDGPASYETTPAAMVGLSALHCGVEALLSGCTAIMDHLYIRDLDDLAAAVAAYRALGIRAFIAPMLGDDAVLNMNYTPLATDAAARNAACPAGCSCGALGPGGAFRTEATPNDPAKTAAMLALWEAAVARFHDPAGGVEIVIGPVTAYSASADLLRGAADIRRRHGLCGHIHLLETRAQALQARQTLPSGSAVRHLHETGFLQLPGTSCAHCVWLDAEEMRLMAAAGASVIHNPLSNLRLGSGVAPLAEYAAAGVNVAVGCDGACSSDGQVAPIRTGALYHRASTSRQIHEHIRYLYF